MKTPDEIKKGLECGSKNAVTRDCNACPYTVDRIMWNCQFACMRDALAYIQQLEAENAALLRDLCEANRADCMHCRHYRDVLMPCSCDCDTCEEEDCACKDCRDNNHWEWRGVQKAEPPIGGNSDDFVHGNHG